MANKTDQKDESAFIRFIKKIINFFLGRKK